MQIEPESRLLLSAILLVIAEQDEKNVKIKHRASERDQRSKKRIAEGAKIFVASSGFDGMCEAVGIEPEHLRVKSPQQAYKAYQKLVSDEGAE